MKYKFAILLTMGLLLGGAVPAKADYFSSQLVPGLVGGNSVVDDSLETFFDTGGNTNLAPRADGKTSPAFGVGDVIVSMTLINTINSNGVANHVYGLIDIQVAGIVQQGSNFDVFFKPTTQPGLTLAALTHNASIPAGGMVAIYSSMPNLQDLFSSPPAGATSIQDYINYITGHASLDLVTGISGTVNSNGPNAANPYYWHGLTSDAGTQLALEGYNADPGNGWVGLNGLTTSNQIAGIDAGLQVLLNNTPYTYAANLPGSFVNPPPTLFFNRNNPGENIYNTRTNPIYQVSVTNAAADGYRNDPNYSHYSDTLNNVVGGGKDNGTLTLDPVAVPAPPSVILLLIGSAGLTGAGFLRRRKVATTA